MRTAVATALFFACGLAISSVVIAAETKAPPPAPGGICPMVYKPVCVEGRTFSNACVAEANGYKSHRPGKCEEPSAAQKCPTGYAPHLFTGGDRRCARPMVGGKCRSTETQVSSKSCKGLPGSPGCPAFCAVGAVGAGPAGFKCPAGQSWEKCAPGAIGTALCPAGGLCSPRCKAGERLFLPGTPFARCQPANAPKCKPDQIEVCASCRPGARCDCDCARRPDGKSSDPCPPGTRWESTCPRGALCIIGGRCVPQAGGSTCPSGMEWHEVRSPAGHRRGCVPSSDGKERDPCPRGKRLTQVVCVRAPCPALCLPEPDPLPRPEKL
jgi:hypothetical protein